MFRGQTRHIMKATEIAHRLFSSTHPQLTSRLISSQKTHPFLISGFVFVRGSFTKSLQKAEHVLWRQLGMVLFVFSRLRCLLVGLCSQCWFGSSSRITRSWLSAGFSSFKLEFALVSCPLGHIFEDIATNTSLHFISVGQR